MPMFQLAKQRHDRLNLAYDSEDTGLVGIGNVLSFGDFRRACSLLAPKEDTDANGGR